MPDRWRDDRGDYDHYDDTTASSMNGYNRGGRPRPNDDWRHDAYEENDWKRRRTNDDGVRSACLRSNQPYDNTDMYSMSRYLTSTTKAAARKSTTMSENNTETITLHAVRAHALASPARTSSSSDCTPTSQKRMSGGLEILSVPRQPY